MTTLTCKECRGIFDADPMDVNPESCPICPDCQDASESPGPRGAETGPDTETYLLDLHQQLRDTRASVVRLEGEALAWRHKYQAICEDLGINP